MNDFDSVVVEFIKEYGLSATYEKYDNGSYDPSSGSVSSSVSSIPVNVILQDLNHISNGFSYKFGTSIQAGDKELYLQPPEKNGGSVLSIDPVTDKVVVNGISYKIVTVKDLYSNEGVHVYTMLVRR